MILEGEISGNECWCLELFSFRVCLMVSITLILLCLHFWAMRRLPRIMTYLCLVSVREVTYGGKLIVYHGNYHVEPILLDCVAISLNFEPLK